MLLSFPPHKTISSLNKKNVSSTPLHCTSRPQYSSQCRGKNKKFFNKQHGFVYSISDREITRNHGAEGKKSAINFRFGFGKCL